ncbi:uncharacterized protein LOC107041099 [Diachasma alloeum]|uniref:uncharacterized protein LOC107041099 n=1 Tax=Diachasma alloeum TaxID=454923 RepID=UPI0007381C4F|nr:uncharacterized protein LOC107041099 [Diachasma alloeum]
MDNLGPNYSSSIWFNSNLFITNGVPLKFYLDGYSLHEFSDMVKIIEAYGGKLSKPDGPDTVIFCEPDSPVGVKGYDRYDIQFFYDSVVALQPQELMNYKLQAFVNQDIANPKDDDGSVNSEHAEGGNDKSLKLTNFGPGDNDELSNSDCDEDDNYNGDDYIDVHSSSTKFHNELKDRGKSHEIAGCAALPPRVECFVKLERLQSTDQDNDNSINVQDESCENTREDDGFSHDSSVSQTIDETDHSQADIDNSIPPSRPRLSTARGNNTPGSFWTEDEHRVLIQYLIDNDVIHRARSTKVWIDCLEKCGSLLNPRRTAESLRARFRSTLRHNYTKYTDDPEALRKFRNIEGTPHVDRLKDQEEHWTDKEDRVLIQYLIDKDAIRQANKIHLWNKCFKACKSLLHPSRDAASLHRRFISHLYKNYAKFTDDDEVLMKFKRMEEIVVWRGKDTPSMYCWTEEESRALAQFLIKNDAIHKAKHHQFWEDHLDEVQAVLNVKRTAVALRNQFYKNLRHNYAKYTDDPAALRQFKMVGPLK